MTNSNIALMAHLMRRAGFGATRDELEDLVERDYESVVDEALAPGRLVKLIADFNALVD